MQRAGECHMRKNSFKAALVQMDSGADERKNMRRAEALLDKAATAGASLVVFPETVDYIGTEMRSTQRRFPDSGISSFPRNPKITVSIFTGVASRREMIAGIRIIQA